MDTRGVLTFLAEHSPPPAYGASVGGADAHAELSGTYEQHEVEIQDGRRLTEALDLDRQGFRLLRRASGVADIYDGDQRTHIYEPECRELIASATGATRVHVFDHTLRSADPERRERQGSREPSSFVHNDYTPRSAPRRVRDLLGDEAEALLGKPFAIVNLWRPIRLVESFPLVVCDARTLRAETLVAAERRAKDRIGEIYVVRFDPAQRWIYFPGMTEDEAVLFKTYDSRQDGRARWCIHTALENRDAAHEKGARESIETRAFAFFDA